MPVIELSSPSVYDYKPLLSYLKLWGVILYSA